MWANDTTVFGPSELENAAFGQYIAISDDGNVIMGASRGYTQGQAQVIVMERQGPELWGHRGAFIFETPAFITAATMSGDGTVVAIAFRNSIPVNNGDDIQVLPGSVTVYKWDGQYWQPHGEHQPQTPEPVPPLNEDDEDGESGSGRTEFGAGMHLSFDGSVLAVGDPTDNAMVGAIWVFYLDGGTWFQLGSDAVRPPHNDRGDAIGSDARAFSLSGDGSSVALFSSQSDQHGSAKVLVHRVVDLAWAVVGNAIVPGDFVPEATSTGFGSTSSLSYDGNAIAIGEPSYTTPETSTWTQEAPTRRGRVHVFDLGEDEWVRRGDAIVGTDSEQLGFAVALSADGTVVAASPDVYNMQTNADTGDVAVAAVRVFRWTGARSPAWEQVGPAIAMPLFNSAEAGLFGEAVDVSGDGSSVLVGARWAEDVLEDVTRNNGAMFVFRTSTPCFHGETLIELADGTVVKAKELAVGMRVRDTAGHVQRIERVFGGQRAPCVFLKRGALGPNVPDRLLILTPNHLVRLPGNGRVVRADEAAAQAGARGGYVPQPVHVYHLGLPDWTFLSVHNVMAETMSLGRHHDMQRSALAWPRSKRL